MLFPCSSFLIVSQGPTKSWSGRSGDPLEQKGMQWKGGSRQTSFLPCVCISVIHPFPLPLPTDTWDLSILIWVCFLKKQTHIDSCLLVLKVAFSSCAYVSNTQANMKMKICTLIVYLSKEQRSSGGWVGLKHRQRLFLSLNPLRDSNQLLPFSDRS